MAQLMPICKFVEGLFAAAEREDGYIMGAKGQDPSKWAEDSWWFTQYTGAQREKALYWREHAARVWDCNGMAEGLYEDYTGININTKARFNYAQWCSVKGEGMIPAERRVPGAAVFWGDGASSIHHVAYLCAPLNSDDPGGDWYMIEARGVMYGVVLTKLYLRKPNFWGWMDKYFDYSAQIATDEPTYEHTLVVTAAGRWNVRSGPGTEYAILNTVGNGAKFEHLATAYNGWHCARLGAGKIGWLSPKCAEVAVG